MLSGAVLVVGIMLTSAGGVLLYFGALGSGHRPAKVRDLNDYPGRKWDALVKSSPYQLRYGLLALVVGLPCLILGLLLRG